MPSGTLGGRIGTTRRPCVGEAGCRGQRCLGRAEHQRDDRGGGCGDVRGRPRAAGRERCNARGARAPRRRCAGLRARPRPSPAARRCRRRTCARGCAASRSGRPVRPRSRRPRRTPSTACRAARARGRRRPARRRCRGRRGPARRSRARRRPSPSRRAPRPRRRCPPRSAASPSIENTPSVTTSRRPAAGAAPSNRSSAARSPCGKTRTSARDSRQPSTIDAWLSASEAHDVARPDQRRDRPRVREVPRGEHHRVLGALPRRDRRLQLAVQGRAAGDQP